MRLTSNWPHPQSFASLNTSFIYIRPRLRNYEAELATRRLPHCQHALCRKCPRKLQIFQKFLKIYIILKYLGPNKNIFTLSLKSLCGLLSVCYKTTLTTGGVGVAGTFTPASKLGPFLWWSLALGMPIYSNLQLNGASGESRKPPDPLFCFKNRGSGGFRVSLKAPFIWKLL